MQRAFENSSFSLKCRFYRSKNAQSPCVLAHEAVVTTLVSPVSYYVLQIKIIIMIIKMRSFLHTKCTTGYTGLVKAKETVQNRNAKKSFRFHLSLSVQIQPNKMDLSVHHASTSKLLNKTVTARKIPEHDFLSACLTSL